LQTVVVEEVLSRGPDLLNREVANFSDMFKSMPKETILTNLEKWKDVLSSRQRLNTSQIKKIAQAMREVPELAQNHRTILTKMAKIAKDRVSAAGSLPKDQVLRIAMLMDVFGTVKQFPKAAIQRVNQVAEEGLCHQPELMKVFIHAVQHAYPGACDKELDRLAKNIIGDSEAEIELTAPGNELKAPVQLLEQFATAMVAQGLIHPRGLKKVGDCVLAYYENAVKAAAEFVVTYEFPSDFERFRSFFTFSLYIFNFCDRSNNREAEAEEVAAAAATAETEENKIEEGTFLF
jgi:hypothetical protein